MMPKTITKEMGYVIYTKIRDVFVKYLPFAVIPHYSPDLEVAVFRFEDSSYIPECLQDASLNIKGNAKLVEKVNNEIKKVLE